MKRYIFLLAFLAGICFATAQTPSSPEMILVKGGTFTMGSNDKQDYAQPPHSVTLSSFTISKYEVTVAQYKAFCQATGRDMPEKPGWGWDDRRPIVNVNYYDATEYCNWLSKQGGAKFRRSYEPDYRHNHIGFRVVSSLLSFNGE